MWLPIVNVTTKKRDARLFQRVRKKKSRPSPLNRCLLGKSMYTINMMYMLSGIIWFGIRSALPPCCSELSFIK